MKFVTFMTRKSELMEVPGGCNRTSFCSSRIIHPEDFGRENSEKEVALEGTDISSHICTCRVCGRQFRSLDSQISVPDILESNQENISKEKQDANLTELSAMRSKREYEKAFNDIQPNKVPDDIFKSQHEDQKSKDGALPPKVNEKTQHILIHEKLDPSSCSEDCKHEKKLVNLNEKPGIPDSLSVSRISSADEDETSTEALETISSRVNVDSAAKPDSFKKLHVCKCGKQFKQLNNLRRHSQLHSGKRPHVCGNCGKQFSRSEALMVHNRIHTGEKPFTCKFCNRKFSDVRSCTRHTSIHTGEKRFVCDQCGKAFHDSTALREHVKAHDNIKPHACSECGFRFAQAAQLRLHMTIHTHEKAFICDECGKRFTRNAHLKNHLKRHRGEIPSKHACTDCNKRFSRLADLKHHTLIHSRDKPHLCVTCGKQFRRAQTLKEHTRLHTGERPYKCSVCSLTFKFSSALKVHMKCHTAENTT